MGRFVRDFFSVADLLEFVQALAANHDGLIALYRQSYTFDFAKNLPSLHVPFHEITSLFFLLLLRPSFAVTPDRLCSVLADLFHVDKLSCYFSALKG